MPDSNRTDFPPYSYVPGHFPHPISDPAGHSFGLIVPKPEPLDPANWQSSTEYLRGIELFNHGYYWEAHEVWESLWHAAGRAGPIADFLKALIKLAAAGVKVREGNAVGVKAHARRAEQLFRQVAEARDADANDSHRLNCDLEQLIAFANLIASSPVLAHTTKSSSPVAIVFNQSLVIGNCS
ncbi:MAG: DUF309 domain-containing protein [Planctomycetia bacterium]|nr:DUF309 domain-containing protein [Planctomycetia bacterium]